MPRGNGSGGGHARRDGEWSEDHRPHSPLDYLVAIAANAVLASSALAAFMMASRSVASATLKPSSL
jgi:hypothetical protein